MDSQPLWSFDDKMGEQDHGFINGTVSDGDISRIFSTIARSLPHPLTNSSGIPTAMSLGSAGLAPTPPPREQEVKCPLCKQKFATPKVLACFHSFCKKCLENQQKELSSVTCPICNVDTILTPQWGVDGLLNDYGLLNMCEKRHNSNSSSDEDAPKDMPIRAFDDKCLIFGSPSSASSSPPQSGSPDCDFSFQNNNHGISNCGSWMQNHGQHSMLAGFDLNGRSRHEANGRSPPNQDKCRCLEHRSQPLRYFCVTCNLAICVQCTVSDHTQPTHQIESIATIADEQVLRMEQMVNDAAKKQQELDESFREIDNANNRLHYSHQHSINAINDTCDTLITAVQEFRQIMIKDQEQKLGGKQLTITEMDKEVQKAAKKMSNMIDFTRRLMNFASPAEIMVFKPLIDSRIESFLKFDLDVKNYLKAFNTLELTQPNTEHVRRVVAELLSQTGFDMSAYMPPPMHNVQSQPIIIPQSNSSPPLNNSLPISNGICISRAGSHNNMGSPPHIGTPDIKNYMTPNTLNGINHMPLLGTSAPAGGLSENSNMIYDKMWEMEESMNGLTIPPDMDTHLSQSLPYQLYPPRSQIKRTKMIYYCKFGEFGVIEGQFTEPSGVAVNAQNDIIVADTNNHRIQVFDKEGRFKFQFGECGKRDGQLLYPNRVCVNRVTGDFIVTERSPTHQIQIFNQYGQFLRKFGANILQHPRGVCVDHMGRIIVVECKVMRVIIFDSCGTVLQKFSCSRYLEFPNGVCATPNNEILISDNRAHCIKVFDYDGHFLRQIGGEGITNYPIGVGINSQGQVVVADNHNNFNLTIFDQQGNMLNALESKVKHAQCFDMALVDDGSVVLASKDYRLYLYRYAPNLSLI